MDRDLRGNEHPTGGKGAAKTAVSHGGVRIRSDIIYAEHGDRKLRADLYAPAGSGPFPIVVAAPGGGWLLCDRRGMVHWGNYLASHGFALLAIEYRTAVAGKMFPEAVCDVISAVQFVQGSARDLDVDPGRVALLGSSAGAHVAALAALAGGTSLFRPDTAGHRTGQALKAFLGIYGVYDLFAHWQQEIGVFSIPEERRSERFLGASPYMDRQLYFDASPISHVCHASNKLPVFLAYGTADDVVSPETQTEPFYRALRQAGYPTRAHAVEGAGHFWFSEEPCDEPGSFTSFLAPRLLQFLRHHL